MLTSLAKVIGSSVRGGVFLCLLLPACSDDVRITTVGESRPTCVHDPSVCPTIEQVNPRVAKPASIVSVYGKNFDKKMKLFLEGEDLEFDFESATTITFKMPSGKNSFVTVSTVERSNDLSLSSNNAKKIYRFSDSNYPVITASPELICSDIRFIDGNGDLNEGTKDCGSSSLAHAENLLRENIKSGIVIAGVTGTRSGSSHTPCKADGETNCLATVNYPAVLPNFLPQTCLAGRTFAGVSCTASAEAHVACATDGQTGCVAAGSFAAAVIGGAASKLLSGQNLAGVSGNVSLPPPARTFLGTSYGVNGSGLTGSLTLPLAADVKTSSAAYGISDAPLTPSYSPDFPSAANVRASDTTNGVTGTLSNCTAGNQDGCVTTASFRSMDLQAAGTDAGLTSANFNASIAAGANFEFWDATGARHSVTGDPDLVAAKILSGSTIFGVTGSVTPIPAACSANGSQSCLVTGTYYAATACSANSSDCYIPTYVQTIQPLKAISSDAIDAGKASIRTSLTLAGIQGTLADCSAANQSACVTTPSYQTFDLSAASGMTDLSSANFNATIQSAGNFEFWDSLGARHQVAGDADLTAANIKDAVVIFGVTGNIAGTPANCASDGDTNCMVDGGNFAAGALVGAADKIIAGQTHAGIAGNVTLPAVGKVLAATAYGVAGTSLSGTLTIPLAADVKTGSGAYGIPGSQLTPAYSPDFPSTANVRASDTVNGVAGVLNDCSAANQSGCVATTTYRTLDLSAASGMTDLTSANFNSTVAAAGNFEFWDSAGNRQQVAGDTDLTAANILNSATIFGVSGSAIVSPAACTTANQSACVATTTFKTMNLTLNGTATGLTAANFNATIKTAANFEFWDAVGVRHSVAGDSDLAAAKVANAVAIFGTTGSATLESHTPCTAANQSGCVSTTTYKTMDLTSASGAITDLVSSTFNATIATGANFEFWDSTGARFEVAGDVDLSASNILSGVNIFGTSGSVTAAPANCSSNGSQGCIATGSRYAATACASNSSDCFVPTYAATSQPLKAISYDAINTGKASIHSSLTLGGIAGTLADCSAANQTACVATSTFKTLDLSAASETDLTASNFNATIATGAAFEYWDSSGARHQGTGTTALSAANIKSGVTLYGVTGQYPSATYPLPSASGTADLVAADFNTQIKSATAFEYWNAEGTYQSGAGDADIVAGNIASGTNIFGATGSVAAGAAPDAWDVRAGTVINGVTGLAKMSCRNKVNTSLWDISLPQAITVTTGNPGTINLTAHGFAVNQTVIIGGTTAPSGLTLTTTVYYVRNPAANTFELSASSGGASINISTTGSTLYVAKWGDGSPDLWDTIDSYNLNGIEPTQVVSGWSSQTNCATGGWEDLTSGGCTTTAKDCVFKDKISGLQWSESNPVTGSAPSTTPVSWWYAVSTCDTLSFGGQTDWRLPTQIELTDAYAHGWRNVGYSGGTSQASGSTLDNNILFIPDIDSGQIWSATTRNVAGTTWTIFPYKGTIIGDTKDQDWWFICVR